jgi:small redox-active disulfide protein 2
MEIKILGTGCPTCKRLEKMTRDVVSEMGIAAEITKVEDVEGMLAYPILGTPGLVIDEELKVSGRLPSKSEIVGWIQGK